MAILPTYLMYNAPLSAAPSAQNFSLQGPRALAAAPSPAGDAASPSPAVGTSSTSAFLGCAPAAFWLTEVKIFSWENRLPIFLVVFECSL